MRKGMSQPVQLLLTATEKVWRDGSGEHSSSYNDRTLSVLPEIYIRDF